jgi:cytochrome c peroxidase
VAAWPIFATLMRTRTVPALAVLAVLAILAACRKDPAVEPPVPGGTGTTPFTLDLPQWVIDSLGQLPVPADNPLTVEGVALGRRLFYEKALSDNYTQSCASCHKQENGFSDPLPYSVGTNGATGTRNAMAVINLAYEDHFFWDGRRHSLEEQAHDPVTNPIEMRNTWPVVVARLQADPDYVAMFSKAFGTTTIDSNLVVKAIAQFERTLLSFNSRYDRYRYYNEVNALNEQEIRGRDLFFRDAHCVDCHREDIFSDHGLRNNGIDGVDPADQGLGALTGNPYDISKFKVPTLRNIAATAPYMHDSRFTTLEQVVNFYANEVHTEIPNLDAHMDPWRFGEIDLNAQEQADLVAFLHTLTDNAFLTNPAFGPPQ